ncbi:MAG: hypothetical protein M5U01_38635 [Ardenticatenaceae bacterium]|nr:hypothetical protein [Ardenticatenaceae bacterium]HBY96146.1 hypothetical protein [Chloroflexota bacterium]
MPTRSTHGPFFAHLLAKPVGGTGSFEGMLATLGFIYSVPFMLLFWLPGAVQLAHEVTLDIPVNIPLMAAYDAAPGLWRFALSVLAVRFVPQVSLPRVIGVTLAAFFLSGLFGPLFFH